MAKLTLDFVGMFSRQTDTLVLSLIKAVHSQDHSKLYIPLSMHVLISYLHKNGA